jgi:hypothetical protein
MTEAINAQQQLDLSPEGTALPERGEAAQQRPTENEVSRYDDGPCLLAALTWPHFGYVIDYSQPEAQLVCSSQLQEESTLCC